MTTPTPELAIAPNENRGSISELKNQLGEIDKEKEAWFGKKSEYSSQIKALISQMKTLKGKRDSLTSEVKGFKQKRDSAHSEFKKIAPTAPPTATEKPKTSGLGRHPELIRKEMERLEQRIETEGLTFEKEKEVMKEIKVLRKEFDQSLSARIELKAARESKAKSLELGKEAESYHHLVVNKARESQKTHEEILAISKKIDSLKPLEKEAYEKFLELKKRFNETSAILRAKLDEAGKERRQREALHQEKEREHQQKRRSSLEEMQKGVEEKIKSKKKITNEDFIVFQKASKKEE